MHNGLRAPTVGPVPCRAQMIGLTHCWWVRLSGTLGEFAPNKRMVELSVNMNPLSGSMPDSIGGLDALIKLRLSFTYLSGSMPARLATLSSFAHLLYMSSLFSGQALC